MNEPDNRPPGGKRWSADNRWALILVAGLVLLALPTLVRLVREGGAPPPADAPAGYTPPAIATPALGATPIPTNTPRRSEEIGALPGMLSDAQLPRGSVVVDLAHYSLIDRARFQPLAAALAQKGVDLRFWLPTVDTESIEQLTDFPDLSAELEKQLAGANALVVVSPFFLYTPAEISVVERFVADGGRLLLISDPDVESDSASDTNQLAAAFNVVFNQDYLYDTAANDENFTYFFQGEFLGEAAALAGSRIAFYGGRSIGGAVEPLVRSADSTLSSLRSGLTSFNTVVLGGSTANGSQGRVLALSDFDVLTDPYAARHDNRRMLQFVRDFLAAAARDNGLPDFPGFLGKEVALAIDSTQPAGALALGKAAELQRMLEASGRVLTLAPAGALTGTQTGPDLIYVAGYRALQDQPDLLADFDLRLAEEVVTATVSAPAVAPVAGATAETPAAAGAPTDGVQPGHKGTPVAPVAPPEVPTGVPLAPEETPTPALPVGTPLATPMETPVATPTGSTDGRGAPPAQIGTPTGTETATGTATESATESATEIATPTGETATPEPTVEPTGESAGEPTDEATAEATPEATSTPTPTPTPTPQIRLLIERADGLRLLADETLLYVRRPRAGDSQLLAVLGGDEQALSAALTRLINRDFAGCLVQSDLILCPYSGGTSGGTGGAASAGGSTASAGGETPVAADTAEPPVTPAPGAQTPAPQTPSAPSAPSDAASILIVDDNGGAASGEPSEAAIYLTALTTAGFTPDLWVVSEQGPPAGSNLTPYAWVIWSDAGYDDSAIDTANLAIIGEYINGGGRLTISSRMPFFGVGAKKPSVIKDVQVADEVPELAAGLPTGPIALVADSPVLSPLEENPDPGAGARTALARGPASADAGAPVLILMTDAGFEDPKGARLLLFGISMGWLPPAVSDQLIRNMADVMLAE